MLSLALIQAEQHKKIQGIRVGRNGCTFTHLLFVDDSLLFFRKNGNSIDNIQCVLQWYCSISRQSINVAKSDLYCSPNMPRVEQEHLASTLKVNLVIELGKYLGLNFKLKSKRVADFHYLVDKLSSKLQGWKVSSSHKLVEPL